MSQVLGRFSKRWWRSVNAPLLASALATLVCLGLYAGHKANVLTLWGVDAWELSTVDARFRLRGPRVPVDDDVVIVGLDDNARRKVPEVFQTRRGWSKLLGALAKYKPKAVGLDVFFASPEINLSKEVVALVKEARSALDEQEPSPAAAKAKIALDAVITEVSGDKILGTAIAKAGNIYLASQFRLVDVEDEASLDAVSEPAGLKPVRFQEVVAIDQPRGFRPRRAQSVIVSMPVMTQGARGGGFVNVFWDADGRVREIPLALRFGDRYYMPLALTLALEALDEPGAGYVVGERAIRIGERRLAIDASARAYVSWLGPSKTFTHISAVDVLDGTVEPAALEGKIVLVGYTDTNRDKTVTPFDVITDGVELHATVIHNIVHNELLRLTSPWVTLMTIAFLGAFITLLQLRRIRQRRPWVVAVGALIAMAGYFILAQVLFAGAGLIVDVVIPVMSGVFISLASLTASLATEGREKAQLRSAFSQYVQGSLVDRILQDPSRARLGGVRRELTVLFSDIIGFTSMSEKLAPEEISSLLNEYLTPMTNLVMDGGGMLDKYIGDAIMAVYGAPLKMEDHAASACKSALAMIKALGPLNVEWKKRNLPDIRVGIGINTGPMSVGNMGSEARFDYTVVGDAVNLSARLEKLTRTYRVDILVGENTFATAGDGFVFREIDLVRVVGREASQRVYQLVGTKTDTPLDVDALDLFQDALESYRSKDWDEAETALTEFLDRFPKDGPATTLQRRIVDFRANPPPDDWDGVYVQRDK